MDQLVVLKTYYHKHDAEMAAGLLKDGGIEVILSSDDAGGFRPHLTLGMGNNRLLIRKEDLEKAQEILQVLEEPISKEQFSKIGEVGVDGKHFSPKYKFIQVLSIAIIFIIALVLLRFSLVPRNPTLESSPHRDCEYVDSGMVCKDYYKDGRIHAIYKYPDQEIDHTDQEFYNSGILRAEWTYFKNKLNGPYREYFENGKLRAEAGFINGKMEGEYREYYETGEVSKLINYRNDEPHGPLQTFYKNGKVAENIEMKDGVRFNAQGQPYQGLQKVYFENGKVWEEWNYKNGKLEGVSKVYYEDGQIEWEVNYHKNKFHGDSKTYYENGRLQNLHQYADNITVFMKEFDRDGNLIYELYVRPVEQE